MTCREKLAIEYPDEINPCMDGGAVGCPNDHGYLPSHLDMCRKGQCTECWDREIPDTTNSHYVQNEKEKTMATKKTKAELEKELEAIKESKAELEKELKNLEKYKQFEDDAGEVHALYTAYMMTGFSEDQAFELTKIVLQNAMTNQTTNYYTPYKNYKR